MPRRKQRKQSKRRTNNARRGNGITTIACSELITQALTSGAATLSLTPATFAGASGLADSFEFYRIIALKYRLVPSATITGNQVAAYIAGVVDATGSNINVPNIQPHASLGVRQTSCSSWVKVPKAMLQSYMTWYKTIAGTPDPAEENQGFLYLAGTGTENVVIEVCVLFQFRSVVPVTATPMVRLQQAMLAEKERLMKILSFDPKTTINLPSRSPSRP